MARKLSRRKRIKRKFPKKRSVRNGKGVIFDWIKNKFTTKKSPITQDDLLKKAKLDVWNKQQQLSNERKADEREYARVNADRRKAAAMGSGFKIRRTKRKGKGENPFSWERHNETVGIPHNIGNLSPADQLKAIMGHGYSDQYHGYSHIYLP